MTRSSLLRSTAALLALAALAACGDAPAAPSVERDLSLDPATAALVNAPAPAPVIPRSTGAFASVAITPVAGVQVGDTTVSTFTVMPSRDAVYTLGRHWIFFQAGSICDPLSANYHAAQWNSSCRAATTPVVVTARVYRTADGAPVVHFDQHLRFAPTKYVILHMSFDAVAGSGTPKIDWLKDKYSAPVDESAQDQAMITRQGDQFMVYRRVKHFSGFIVPTGRLSERTGYGVDVGLDRYVKIPGMSQVGPGQVQGGHVVATGAVSQPLQQ